ncbi:MAG: hypothetical protein JKY48_14145, partial [Flavobacteriales bacterium]|nr:hypothetical protein [Flavobacteriales bacterium]
KDNSFLSLDLIHRFQRKWTNMLDSNKILISTIRKGSLRVPEPRFDLGYTLLFYFLNGVSIPQKYQDYFLSFEMEQKRKMKIFIQQEYALEAKSLEGLFQYTEASKKKIEKVLKLRAQNNGIKLLFNLCNYLKDTFVELRKRRGFIVTFSGVDGAGKSSTINRIVEKVSKQYRRKVIVLRHRPSILPILSALIVGKEKARENSMSRLPRSGKNKSIIGSMFRFVYYYLDYVIGQHYVYFKYILRGHIVLYDRYYFDFINDSKRSNIILPKWFTKALYVLISKPKLNIFLYASPDVIRSRKKELDRSTIKSLTADYRNLFDSYSKKYKESKYIQIENVNRNRTDKIIMAEMLDAA